jgi:hypothetical protein
LAQAPVGIALHLERSGDDFLVVDTNCNDELQKLYKIQRDTPIFDPFPDRGKHYRDFIDHLASIDCRCHIVGIKACRDMLQALQDPWLARSPQEVLPSSNQPQAPAPHGGRSSSIGLT